MTIKDRARKQLSRMAGPPRLAMREFLDHRAMLRIPAESVYVNRLRPTNSHEIHGLLKSKSAEAAWRVDEEQLAKVNPPDYASGVNPGDQRALYSLVHALRPERILEVGTHIGSSTLAMALACRRSASNVISPTILSVDIRDVNDEKTKPWAYFGSDASPHEKLRQLALDGLVEFQVGDSVKVLSEQETCFDFVFLDGSHRAPAVYREIPAAIRALAPGGLVVMHDVFPDGQALWPGSRPGAGPWQAASRLVSDNPALRLIPLGELPWPTKYGGRLTSLAVLSRVSEEL